MTIKIIVSKSLNYRIFYLYGCNLNIANEINMLIIEQNGRFFIDKSDFLSIIVVNKLYLIYNLRRAYDI